MAAKYQLSKKEILEEIVKCGKNPIYFIDNYARIVHPVKGSILFKLFPFQREVLEDFIDYRFNIINKARQLGLSTLVAAYCAWFMLFHKDKSILVMATQFATAANLTKKVKKIIMGLPPWLRISDFTTDNAVAFELKNGSSIKASSTSITAGRSEALSLLIIDEAAHVENCEELWTSLYPTISTGGRCIAVSTPNGAAGWFYRKFIDAEAGINDFHHNRLMWDIHPERNEEWFANETRNMSQKQIAQELLCEFLASGQTVVDAKDIKWVETCVKEPSRRDGYDKNIWIWEDFKQECQYLLTADTARGDGADFSTFAILNLKTMEVDVEYQGKIDIDSFARMLMNYGKEYGGCMIVGENNNIGFAVLTKLIEWGYPNLYYSTKGTQEFLDAWEAENVGNSIVGFSMTGKIRPLLFAKFEEYIRAKQVIFKSARFANELKTFIWNNGRPEAQKDCNDDLCCAYAFACWVRDTAIINNSRDLEYKKAMLDAMFSVNRSISTGLGDMRKQDRQQKQNKPLPWDLPEQNKTDINQNLTKSQLWILKG